MTTPNEPLLTFEEIETMMADPEIQWVQRVLKRHAELLRLERETTQFALGLFDQLKEPKEEPL